MHTYDFENDWWLIEPAESTLVVNGIPSRRQVHSSPMFTVRYDHEYGGGTATMRCSQPPMNELELDQWVRSGALPNRRLPYLHPSRGEDDVDTAR
ncbi:MAG: hypothetical protein ABWX96_17625 [Propionibacteriaceae bacterium]